MTRDPARRSWVPSEPPKLLPGRSAFAWVGIGAIEPDAKAEASGAAATFGFEALGRLSSETVGSATATYAYLGISSTVAQVAGPTTTDRWLLGIDGVSLGLSVGSSRGSRGRRSPGR